MCPHSIFPLSLDFHERGPSQSSLGVFLGSHSNAFHTASTLDSSPLGEPDLLTVRSILRPLRITISRTDFQFLSTSYLFLISYFLSLSTYHLVLITISSLSSPVCSECWDTRAARAEPSLKPPSQSRLVDCLYIIPQINVSASTRASSPVRGSLTNLLFVPFYFQARSALPIVSTMKLKYHNS